MLPHDDFVCLLGLNSAFKHLRSYHGNACLKQLYFDHVAATLECHATDTGYDTQPHHSI